MSQEAWKTIAYDELARRLAKALWPEKYIEPGKDCRKEVGREGEPCRICADAHHEFNARIERVRRALEEVLT